MAHILLISNNETINSLYPINLSIYLASDVTLKPHWEAAKKVLDARPHLDLIIALKDDVQNVLNYVESEQLSVPVLCIGELKNNVFKKLLNLKDPTDIPDMLKTIAKLFNITAKIMAEKKVENYFPVSVKLISKLSKLPVDAFMRTENGHTKVGGENIVIEKTLRLCKSNQVDTVYIDAVNRFKIVQDVTSKLIVEFNNSELEVDAKVLLNEQGFEFISEHISDMQTINEEFLSLNKLCVEASKDIIKRIPELKVLLETLINNKAGYVFTHSIMISFVCKHIVKHVSWGGQGHGEKLAFIAFYHDLFLVPLYKKYPEVSSDEGLLTLTKLTAVERETVLQHAKLVGDLIAKFPRTHIGSDVITRQHHGSQFGIGFARDYKEDLSPLAKVFLIAEMYVNEILKALNFPKVSKINLSSFDKESIIKTISNKYTRPSYRKIIEVLDKVPF